MQSLRIFIVSLKDTRESALRVYPRCAFYLRPQGKYYIILSIMFNLIITFLAGIAVFMFGMKYMGDQLESAAGKPMRKLFAKISNNRFAGVGIGAGVTGIVQSSGATTVMVIGLVNAGVLSLFQATSIIMGANIGTTVTGLIISLKSFNIMGIMGLFAFVGVFMLLFTKNGRVKKIACVLIGVGLLFIGLNIMSGAVNGIKDLNEDALVSFFSAVHNPFLLILIGIFVTALIQSSSVTTGIVIITISANIQGFDILSAFYIILGTNIGTCLTAWLASIGAGVNAKRAALIHLSFNVIGTVLFTAVFLLIGRHVQDALYSAFNFSGDGDGFFTAAAPQIVAWFHVVFNVTTTLVLLPFVKILVKWSEFVIRDKNGKVDYEKLYYLDERILNTPPIAVAQVLKETINLGELAKSNFDRAYRGLLDPEAANPALVAKDEKQINFITHAITHYLVQISSMNLSSADEKLIGSLHHVVSDLERIGDHAQNISEFTEKIEAETILLSAAARAELKELYDVLMELFELSLHTFTTRDAGNLKKVNELEETVDTMQREFTDNHILRLKAGDCGVESGAIFTNILSDSERVADHLTNISYSLLIRKNPALKKTTIEVKP